MVITDSFVVVCPASVQWRRKQPVGRLASFRDFAHSDLLFVVGAGPVVQHGIPVHEHLQVFALLAERNELLLGSEFRANSSLLVKLAKIVKVVDVVTLRYTLARRVFDKGR